MHEIIKPTHNRGGLYLGNVAAARDRELQLKHNINAILTVAFGYQNLNEIKE